MEENNPQQDAFNYYEQILPEESGSSSTTLLMMTEMESAYLGLHDTLKYRSLALEEDQENVGLHDTLKFRSLAVKQGGQEVQDVVPAKSKDLSLPASFAVS